MFVPSLTAMIGFWATLSLNMPDFTRFGRSQREQIIGQVVALPTTMSLFAAMGVMITSATAIIYGQAIWDPVELVGKFSSPVVVAISMFTVVVATLAVNIAANVVSPANDFANAFPRFISFKTGGLITGLLGIVIQPWRLLADPSGYIFTWLLGYSGGLGSIAGVLIADYWIVRRRELRLEDLYLADGEYGGWNLRAIAATAVGCASRLGRLRRPRAQAALRLRLVRRLLRRWVGASGVGGSQGTRAAVGAVRRPAPSDPASAMACAPHADLTASSSSSCSSGTPWARIRRTRGMSSAPSHRAITIVATALPMRLVIARASDMKRSTPSSSARPASGMLGNADSVAASVMNPLPVTAAAPFEVSSRMPSSDSCCAEATGARRSPAPRTAPPSSCRWRCRPG